MTELRFEVDRIRSRQPRAGRHRARLLRHRVWADQEVGWLRGTKNNYGWALRASVTASTTSDAVTVPRAAMERALLGGLLRGQHDRLLLEQKTDIRLQGLPSSSDHLADRPSTCRWLAADRGIVAIPAAARDLGARGSHAKVADADPVGPVSAAAAAVLAAVPGWWAARAREAGLSGRWLDVTSAVAATPPALPRETSPDPSITALTSSEGLGAASAAALPSEVRARHGRHYTPPGLAEHLWTMTRQALGHPIRATRLPGLVRDRACGAGALLLPALREHVRASARTDPQLTRPRRSSAEDPPSCIRHRRESARLRSMT